jgi:hypothetical protein
MQEKERGRIKKMAERMKEKRGGTDRKAKR